MMTLRAPTFWKAEDQMQQRRVRWQGGHRCSSASPGVFHGRVSSLPSQSSPGRLPGSSAWPLGTWGDAGAPVQVGSRGCLPAPACGPCRSTALSPPTPHGAGGAYAEAGLEEAFLSSLLPATTFMPSGLWQDAIGLCLGCTCIHGALLPLPKHCLNRVQVGL